MARTCCAPSPTTSLGKRGRSLASSVVGSTTVATRAASTEGGEMKKPSSPVKRGWRKMRKIRQDDGILFDHRSDEHPLKSAGVDRDEDLTETRRRNPILTLLGL